MHAMSSYQNGGSKITKIAVVTLLHVAVGFAMLQMRITVKDPVTYIPDVTLVDPVKPREPEPIPVVDPPPSTVPPIFVPAQVITTTSPPPTQITAATVPPTVPPGPIEGPATIAPPPPVVAKVVPVERKVFEAATNGNCALPNYPANAARNGDTGTVGLALLIAPDGRVTDSKVTSSSGFRELDRAAVAALSMCKFKPATTNGVPEAAWGKIAYVWTLEQ